MASFPGVHHVAVTVTDLDRSPAWYRQMFGAEPVLDEDTGAFYHKVAAFAAVHAPRARVGDFFSAQDIARSQHYRGLAYVLAFLSLGLNLAVLTLIGLGRGSRALASWSERVTRGRWWLQTLVLAAIVSVVPAVVVLPPAIAAWGH